MSRFKYFDDGDPFLKPEKPFLLIWNDPYDEEFRHAWFEDEEELLKLAAKVTKSDGCKIVDALEIGCCREIKIDGIE